jgi:hypothetical protein
VTLQPLKEAPPAGSGLGTSPTDPPMAWCWSDELQTYYHGPMPCPPTKTSPPGLPPSGGQGPVTAGGGGTSPGSQGVWCWSDQSKSYLQLPSYPCPPGSVPSGPPASGQTPSRPGGRVPGLPIPGSTLPGAVAGGVVTVPPRSPPGPIPQTGGGGTTGGGNTPPYKPPIPPVAQVPGTQTPPASSGQCPEPLCYYAGQEKCQKGPLPNQPGWIAACKANVIARCHEGENAPVGGWCIRPGAEKSCQAKAQAICGK